MIEEYIYEMTRAVGDGYTAIIDGIGDTDQPGTALFAVAQLNDLAENSIPYFGVLRTVNPDDATYVTSKAFRVEVPNIAIPEIYINTGFVAYNSQVINIEPQYVTYAREFADSYSTDCIYGAVVGLPISEAQRYTSVYTTLVAATAAQGSHILRVDDISVATNLGFPLKAKIGNEIVDFVGVTQQTVSGVVYDVLEIEPSSSGLIMERRTGTQVYFMYTPSIRCVCGLPVTSEHQSSQDASVFAYYPPVPKDWLLICKFLVSVKNGTTQPRIYTTEPIITDVYTDYALVDLVVDYPYGTTADPVFTTSESATIISAAQATGSSLLDLKQKINPAEIIRAIQSYTDAVKTNSTTTFRKFWASLSFKPTTYFTRGVSFDNLERFVFPDNFIKTYYAFTGSDLHHVFAIFRGDLYQSNNYSISNNIETPQEEDFSITSVLSRTAASLLTKGTYVYGITAVNTRGQETSALYIQNTSITDSAYMNVIDRLTTEDASIKNYHIYRRQNLVGNQVEYRLTADDQITTLVPPNSPELSQLIADMSFTSVTDRYMFTSASGNTSASGITSASGDIYASWINSTICGGIGLKLRFDSGVVIKNTSATLSVNIYESDKTTLKSEGTPITYGQIIASNNYSEYIVKFDNVILDANTVYWIGLTQSELPKNTLDATVELKMQRYSNGLNGSEFGIYSSSGYNVSDYNDTYFKMYGFTDDGNTTSVTTTKRGIKLTGATSLTPSRLRVYVPNIELTAVEPYTRTDEVDPGSTNTRNEVIITVIAKNGEYGIPYTFTQTVPQNTIRNTEFLLGAETDLFDRVVDVQVQPGAGSNLRVSQGHINWSIYDLITVETVP